MSAQVSVKIDNGYTVPSPALMWIKRNQTYLPWDNDTLVMKVDGAYVVGIALPPANITLPTIAGLAQQGATLTVTPGTWSGNPEPVLTYQWYRGASAIAGATNLTYVVVEADAEKTITCRETGTNSTGSLTVASNGIAIPITPVAPINIIAPTIHGTAGVGATLTCAPGTWTGVPTPTLTYQWQADGVDIPGETGLTHVVTADGQTITCIETATNTEGSSSLTTNGIHIPNTSEAPTNVILPSIAGNTAQGGTLTCTPGEWEGNPAPTYTYQWYRGATPISGATGLTHVVVAADAETTVTCRETATNVAGSLEVTSNSLAIPAIPVLPAVTTAPSISGATTLGSTLTCAPGVWTGVPTPVITRKWKRNTVAIPGATGLTYVLVSADSGVSITCTETATNSVGAVDSTSNSLAIPAFPTLPVNTQAPSITGTPTVGSTLTCTPGAWTGVPTPTKTYQWYADSNAISGQTALTHVVTSADVTKRITCVEIATNSEGSAQQASNGITIPATMPANISLPVISGNPQEGATLTVTPGTWSGLPVPTIAHQWQSAGVDVSGQTGLTYVVRAEDVGGVVTCVESATNVAGTEVATSNGLTIAAPAITPADLFANGERGFWYDPSDLTTLFADKDGTVPVTGTGQPVLYMLDKSGNSNHLIQSASARAPIYRTDGTLHWLDFDGADNRLQSETTINLSTINKFSTFGGIRKEADGPGGIVYEFGANATSTNGTFNFTAPRDAGTGFSATLRGTAYLTYGTATFSAPVNVVFSTLMDLAAATTTEQLIPRINGTVYQNAPSGTTVGGDTFSDRQLNIGMRNATSLPFNGNIYGLVGVGRTVTAQEITDMESWMAEKTGVTLP